MSHSQNKCWSFKWSKFSSKKNLSKCSFNFWFHRWPPNALQSTKVFLQGALGNRGWRMCCSEVWLQGKETGGRDWGQWEDVGNWCSVCECLGFREVLLRQDVERNWGGLLRTQENGTCLRDEGGKWKGEGQSDIYLAPAGGASCEISHVILIKCLW